MPSFQNSTPDSISQAPLVSVPLHKIGLMTTTGSAPPPPVCLTCKVLSHLKVCNAAGTLVVPLWRSAHFWPRLCFDGLHWSGFVHDWVILPDLPNLFVRGKAKNSIFGRGSLPFPSVALRIDFTTVPRQGSGLVCEVFRVPDL